MTAVIRLKHFKQHANAFNLLSLVLTPLIRLHTTELITTLIINRNFNPLLGVWLISNVRPT